MANLNRRFPTGTRALVRRLSTEVISPAAAREDKLYRRLSALSYTKETVANTLNGYISEGKAVTKFELETCIKQLRRYKNFNHALEIMEWMEVRQFNFVHKDYAIRLDLIGKAKGIAAAENYFRGLSPSVKVCCTYGALLNCYCSGKITRKALEVFAKMIKENVISKALPFSNLMGLYIRLGQPEKVAILGEEMKKLNILPDTMTNNMLMMGYSLLNDIEGVERVFEEMKREGGKQCNWTTYSNLACIYMKRGDKEKVALTLKILEEEMPLNNREAYHFLISLYSGISDLHNVHRIWKSLKSTLRVVTNKSYLMMLHALKKLNDIKGMKKCFEEWESSCSNYDLRLANAAIGAYLTHDMLEEAETVLQNAVKRSEGPFFNAWEMFVIFFLKSNQIKQALEIMDIATSKVRNSGWHPKSGTKDGFLNYFKEEGDVSGVEEFYKFMKRINCVDRPMFVSLLETYVAAGKTQLDMRMRIEGDGIEINNELEHLLASVCPE